MKWLKQFFEQEREPGLSASRSVESLTTEIPLDAAAEEALALLNRIKTFTLPSGRMPAAREIAQRLASTLRRFRSDGEPVEDSDDPAAILDVLQTIERELIALGGAPASELAAPGATIERVFPDAKLVAVRPIGAPSTVEDEAATSGQPAKIDREIPPAVRAELERIWPEAERLGWPRERIWGAKFWPAEMRGLGSLLDPGDRLIEVASDFIVIEKDDGRATRLRFRRYLQ